MCVLDREDGINANRCLKGANAKNCCVVHILNSFFFFGKIKGRNLLFYICNSTPIISNGLRNNGTDDRIISLFLWFHSSFFLLLLSKRIVKTRVHGMHDTRDGGGERGSAEWRGENSNNSYTKMHAFISKDNQIIGQNYRFACICTHFVCASNWILIRNVISQSASTINKWNECVRASNECNNNQNGNAIMAWISLAGTRQFYTLIFEHITTCFRLLTRCKIPIAVFYFVSVSKCNLFPFPQQLETENSSSDAIRIKYDSRLSLFALPYSNFLHQIFTNYCYSALIVFQPARFYQLRIVAARCVCFLILVCFGMLLISKSRRKLEEENRSRRQK